MNHIQHKAFILTICAGIALWLGQLRGAAQTGSDGVSGDIRPATPFAYGYTDEPYVLESGPHLFIDWRYVYPGRVNYSLNGKEVGKEGEGVTPDDIDSVLATPDGFPSGIRLEAVKPESLGAVIEPDKPWEYLLAYTSLVHAGPNDYRLYYEAIPSHDSAVPSLLCVATSSDGVNWTKPSLGIIEWEGSTENNIVHSGAVTRFGMHGHQVFIDPRPDVPADEKFKLVYMGTRVNEKEPGYLEQYAERYPASINEHGMTKGLVIMAATSPDGYRWTERAEPIMSHMNDSGPSVYWDEHLQRWVGFWRHNFMNRRSIGRNETTDFWHWPAPELLLWSDAAFEPSGDYYTNSHALYPGTSKMHLMFPAIYLRKIDGAELRAASSIDGLNWQWLPGGPILKNGPAGTWDAGFFVGCVGMAEIPDGRVIMPYLASPLPHKFPRVIPLGKVGLIAWPRERIAALVADEVGHFQTGSLSLQAAAGALLLNFQSHRAGVVRVGIQGVQGRSIEDCDPLFGDKLEQTVTWGGDSALNVEPGRSFTLEFKLHNARLFSFEFR